MVFNPIHDRICGTKWSDRWGYADLVFFFRFCESTELQILKRLGLSKAEFGLNYFF